MIEDVSTKPIDIVAVAVSIRVAQSARNAWSGYRTSLTMSALSNTFWADFSFHLKEFLSFAVFVFRRFRFSSARH
jgi:hypothetical protein